MSAIPLSLVTSEWPDSGLDIEPLRDSGWRPTPFDQFVVKIHSRCNLACDYCYMYELADQSWKNQPIVMSRDIIRATARRIGEHADRHALPSVVVVLHGGEPLLAGFDLITFLAREFRAALSPSVALRLDMQTNGTLLSTKTLDALLDLGIGISVSLDGDHVASDRHRRNRRGASSHADVLRGLELLTGDKYRHLFRGLLAVVDLANDPIVTYESLAALAPPKIDFLLPHGTWAAPPPGKAMPDGGVDTTDTRYAYWLITAFDHWYGLGRSRVGVRVFDSAIGLLLGRNGTSEQFGTGVLSFLTIETNGAIEQVDSLKVAFDGAPGTGLHVLRDEFDAAFDIPGVVARQIGVRGLSPTCQECRLRDSCGGGLYAQRYRPGTGFLNPSVYCADLMAFLDHVSARLRADLSTIVKA